MKLIPKKCELSGVALAALISRNKRWNLRLNLRSIALKRQR